ncbi:MAG TPA: hypothetical protein VJ749_05450 [Pyrinomonadaceae bacterium]|jgi:hypothetical protein|nr:hypothetical protein [Pyrinomonadaceae bacterium]
MLEALQEFVHWWTDEGGLEPAEWAIVLGAVIVPLAYFILQITLYLTRFYEITSWITTLPFP